MRAATLGLLIVAILTGFLVRPLSAADWPRFRGQNGSGIATDKEIPIKWSDRDGVLWKADVPGVGHSSPVVWGNNVFLQSSSVDGKERYLLCFRASDGKQLWSSSLTGGLAKTHVKNNLSASTPATDGERIYALFWDGRDQLIAAFDFKGAKVWERNLGKFTSQHGAGASPIVFDGKVFLNNDQDGSAAIVALDAATGKPAWETTRKAYRACYSTPFLLEKAGGGMELIVGSTAGLTGYDPRSGKEIWSWTWSHSGMPLRTVASPVAGQGLIFANAGDGSGTRHTVAVKTGDKGDVSRTNLVWETEKGFAAYVPSMLLWEDHLYFVNDTGVAYCCKAKTGEVVWSERLGAGNVSASPILIDGKIYAATEKGDVFVFPAATSYKLLAKNSVGEPVIATPAVANNRLFIRGKSHLYCIAKVASE